MNRRLAVAVFLVLLLGVAAVTLYIVDRVEGNRDDSRQRFSQVQIGQSRDEVTDILGDPEPTIQDLASSDACTVYVQAHESVDPFVEFCFDGSESLVRVVTLTAD